MRDTVQFTCGVTGSNPISYEWFKNGNLLADNTHFSGTTTASLRIMSVASDDYGKYSCRASNPVNSVRSRGALLTGDCVCVCVCVCACGWGGVCVCLLGVGVGCINFIGSIILLVM